MPADRDPAALAVALIGLLEASRPVPWWPRQARVHRLAVYETVAAIRKAAGTEDLVAAADAVREAVFAAPLLPLSEDVRLPREQVARLLDLVRQAGAGTA